MSFLCQTYEDRRQHCKYVSLKECHQQFQAVHKNHKQQRHRRHRAVNGRTHVHRNEDYAAEAQYNRVTREDVCEKTHHQRERLGEYPYNLNDRHQGNSLQEDGDIRPKYLLVVMLAPEQVNRQIGRAHV